MSSVASTSAANSTTATAGSGILGVGGKGDLQQQFLQLLVAELKNQDPSDPIKNDQMVSQMAQLSSVSGISNMNQSLQTLASNFRSSQALQAANMIGRQVLTPGSTTELANGKANFGLELSGPADHVLVSINDSTGSPVHTLDLGAQEAGILPLEWDGVADNGASVAPGSYTFGVNATLAGQPVQATGLSFGTLQSVSTTSTGAVNVGVQGVGTVGLSELRQII